MAARKRTWTPQIVRDRIRVGVIARRLQDHILGKIEMTPTQVNAAKVLLAKAMPDLRAIEHSGEIARKTVRERTDAELNAIAAGGSTGAADEAESAPGTAPIH